jgi:hypothetical protein
MLLADELFDPGDAVAHALAEAFVNLHGETQIAIDDELGVFVAGGGELGDVAFQEIQLARVPLLDEQPMHPLRDALIELAAREMNFAEDLRQAAGDELVAGVSLGEIDRGLRRQPRLRLQETRDRQQGREEHGEQLIFHGVSNSTVSDVPEVLSLHQTMK